MDEIQEVEPRKIEANVCHDCVGSGYGNSATGGCETCNESGWKAVPCPGCEACTGTILDTSQWRAWAAQQHATATIREGDELPATFALNTEPDGETLRFIAVRWWNGNFGQRRNGEGTVTSGGEGWQFKGSFLASGREVYFTKRNLLDLQTVLRGRGWLPETNSGMVGE